MSGCKFFLNLWLMICNQPLARSHIYVAFFSPAPYQRVSWGLRIANNQSVLYFIPQNLQNALYRLLQMLWLSPLDNLFTDCENFPASLFDLVLFPFRCFVSFLLLSSLCFATAVLSPAVSHLMWRNFCTKTRPCVRSSSCLWNTTTVGQTSFLSPAGSGTLGSFDMLQMGSGTSAFTILYTEGRKAFRWNHLAILSPLCLKRHSAGSTIPNKLFRLMCKNIYLLTFAARCTRYSQAFRSPAMFSMAIYSAG